MRLLPKKGGHGHVTSYNALIGSAEARRVGFIDENGKSYDIEKIVDEKKKIIILKVRDDMKDE